jgi:hypothetical protein
MQQDFTCIKKEEEERVKDLLTWLGVGCGCGVQQLDELVSCFIKFLCLFLQVDNVLQFFLENDSLEFEEIVKKYSDELSETVFF